MSASIIEATADDVDRAAPLFDSYRQFYGMDSDLDGARAFLAERLERSESIVLLALAQPAGVELQEAVGFAQLYPTFSSISLRPTLVLNDLFVRGDVRSHGLGRQLIGAATAIATRRRAASLELATATTNDVARRLYESMGFRRDDRFIHLALPLGSDSSN